jgi:hypothetical protein
MRRRAGGAARLAAVGVAAVACVLAWAAAASSAPGDPKIHLNSRDQSTAGSVLLRRPDLPAGVWLTTPTDFSQPNPPCIVKSYSLEALTATGRAGFTYTQTAGLPVVESDAHVFATRAQTGRAFAIFSNAGFARCLGSSVAAQSPSTTLASVGRFSLGRLGVTAAGYRIVLGVTSSQTTKTLNVVMVALERGRVLATLSVLWAGTSWPQATVRELATKIAGRMLKQ